MKRFFSVILVFILIIQMNVRIVSAEADTDTLDNINEDIIINNDNTSILEGDLPEEDNSLEEEIGTEELDDNETGTVTTDQQEEIEDETSSISLLSTIHNVGNLSDLQTVWGNITAGSGSFTINITDDINLGSQIFTIPSGTDVTIVSDAANTLKQSSGRHFIVYGKLTLGNILLDGNNSGGGIQINSGGSLYMESGSAIQNCRATTGGGLYVDNGEVYLNASDVYIKGNTTTADGAGIYMTNNSKLVMNNGNITDNIARTALANGGLGSGGGVYITNSSSFTMYNGHITKNIARQGGSGGFAYGGGVYIGNDSNFSMDGGIISQNTAAVGGSIGFGGGVHIGANSNFFMDGGTISQNTAAATSAAIGYGAGVSMAGNSFTMGSGSVISDNVGGGYGFSYGGGVHIADGVSTMNAGSKIYSNQASFGGGVSVNSGTFTMNTDSEIYSNRAANYGGGVYVLRQYDAMSQTGSFGTFLFNGGSIEQNNASIGGGIYVSGIVEMSGGNIYNNTATTSGGGVYVHHFYDGLHLNGLFTLYDGSIEKNKAPLGGGVYVYGIFEMVNGVIKGNTATSGGGVYVSDDYDYYMDFEGNDHAIKLNGSFTMNGGSMVDNQASSGGGIYTKDYNYVTVSANTVFNGNSANRLAESVNAEDQAIHAANIHTAIRSETTEFLYNNYDINYVNYVATFYDADSATILQTYTAYKGGSIALPAGPIKYYQFNEWVPQGSYTASNLSNVEKDMNFKASYTTTVNQFTVLFDSNDGSSVDSQTAVYGDYAVEPMNPTKEGYEFGGWYSDLGFSSIWDFTTTVTNNMTLYAKWTAYETTPVETVYVVTFHSNNGSAVASQSVYYEAEITEPETPTKDGFTFAGWYRDNGTFEDQWDFETKITENTTLYAKWTEVDSVDPDENTSDVPDENTSDVPDENTSDVPDGNTSDVPDGNTSNVPDENTSNDDDSQDDTKERNIKDDSDNNTENTRKSTLDRIIPKTRDSNFAQLSIGTLFISFTALIFLLTQRLIARKRKKTDIKEEK